MKEAVQKVRLMEPIDVNKITISRDHYFSKAYIIDLPLDSTPNHVWQDIFIREWKSSRHVWDRKLFVMGDKLRLVTTASDLEDKLDWIKQVIERTNAGIDEYNKEAEARAVQMEESLERTVREEEEKSEMIRETIRKRFRTF